MMLIGCCDDLMWFINCKEVIWMIVNNDHESSTNMISVVNKIAKELFDYCKHPQSEIRT